MKNLAKAILEAMRTIGYLQKDKTVGSGGSAYKGLSDQKATQGIREALMGAGIIAIPTIVEVTPNCKTTHFEGVDSYGKPAMKLAVFTEVRITYTLIHAETGEAVAVQAIGHGVDNGDKSAGKAMTYAKKNALLNALLISSGLDADDVHSDDLPTQPVNPPTFEADLQKVGKASKLAKFYATGLAIDCPPMTTAEEADKVARQLYKQYYGL